jgi:hypothetical protein
VPRDQIDTVFADIKPPHAARKQTQAERLAPYRRAIMKQCRRGLTWMQIAGAMADPRIRVKVSEKTLRQTFGDKPADAPAATSKRDSDVAPDSSGGPDAD